MLHSILMSALGSLLLGAMATPNSLFPPNLVEPLQTRDRTSLSNTNEVFLSTLPFLRVTLPNLNTLRNSNMLRNSNTASPMETIHLTKDSNPAGMNTLHLNTLKTSQWRLIDKTQESQRRLKILEDVTNKLIENRILAVSYDSRRQDRIMVLQTRRLLGEDGAFTDLEYDRKGESQELREHGRRLKGIVFLEIQELQELSKNTQASFSFLTYQMPPITSKNWWLHLIGVPTSLWQAFYEARNHLPTALKKDFIARYFSDTSFGPVWNYSHRTSRISGGNLGPRLLVGLVQHFMEGSMERFHLEAKKFLYREVVLRDPFNGDGLRADGCLHQHNQFIVRKHMNGSYSKIRLSNIYNNNYGKEFLKYTSIVMWVLDGTLFDLGDEIEEGIFASYFECHNWLNRYKTVEPSSVGRFIDSGEVITRTGGIAGIYQSLKYLRKINRHQDDVIAAQKRYNNRKPERKFALEGNKHFFVSDLMAHHRHNYMITLRLLSPRTSRPETIVPKGYSKTFFKGTPQGYFMGDGFMTILVTGKELGTYKREIFQAYDWSRVPGVTCQYTEDVPQESTVGRSLKHSYNEGAFTGGVSNGIVGVAVLDYARPTVALRARKSWFMFGGATIALGSGITLMEGGGTDNPVITTLNQVIYNGHYYIGDKTRNTRHHTNESSLSENLKGGKDRLWVHHGGVGYVTLIPEGQVKLEVERRFFRGSMKDSYSAFSLWLDHGPTPKDASYGYALIPGQPMAKTREFAGQPSSTILALGKDLHAVCDLLSQTFGASFFLKGCASLSPCITTIFEEVCTDEPILMIISTLPHKSSSLSECPNGVTSLKDRSIHVNTNSSTYYKYPELYERESGYSKLHNFHKNDIWALDSRSLRVSVADPTQKLSRFNVRLRGPIQSQDIPILLPRSPRSGESVTHCFNFF